LTRYPSEGAMWLGVESRQIRAESTVNITSRVSSTHSNNRVRRIDIVFICVRQVISIIIITIIIIIIIIIITVLSRPETCFALSFLTSSHVLLARFLTVGARRHFT